jgi:sirohydrochlorin cobaltochelatase
MAATLDEFEVMQARLRTLLPEVYQDSYEEVKPVSMGSAGLKYGDDGQVAWDEIWRSFCDLAMAGGPPHRGRLLEPAAQAEIELEPERYGEVVAELCRGVEMVTGLAAESSRVAGWIEVECPSTTMAGWLVRAINMENVSAHVEGMVLHLPVGPEFRVEKEVKNVVTSIAKTCHYWVEHMSVAQHRAIADLFEIMDEELALVQAPVSSAETSETLSGAIAEKIYAATGLEVRGGEYHGWLGINCLGVRAAIWMMRMMVVSNVVCRREENSIYVPVDEAADGSVIAGLVARAARLAKAQSAI